MTSDEYQAELQTKLLDLCAQHWGDAPELKVNVKPAKKTRTSFPKTGTSATGRHDSSYADACAPFLGQPPRPTLRSKPPIVPHTLRVSFSCCGWCG